ncbi:hypothetical protein J2736_002917 [Paenibacillus qinlingensis]|uniref:Uncharacterized protein n=1 Tax=Paenibacillus qinlingensis TaxID=1837343 RepID=A0ABU1NW77_9BACL|nr:hypothetical protein [Paenibacillus qinlingensis]
MYVAGHLFFISPNEDHLNNALYLVGEYPV